MPDSAAGPFESEADARAAVRRVYAAAHASNRRSVMADLNHRMLCEAISAAGVEVGAYDHRLLLWLAGYEPQTVAVFAALITRAHAAGRDSPKERTVTTQPDNTGPLPGWSEMTDLDKGAALLHLHKREWEGAEYAESDYPARYFDHPALTALTPMQACRHAVSVEDAADRAGALGAPEYDRLYDAALDADRVRSRQELGL